MHPRGPAKGITSFEIMMMCLKTAASATLLSGVFLRRRWGEREKRIEEDEKKVKKEEEN